MKASTEQQPRPEGNRFAVFHDLCERIIVFGLFGWLIYRLRQAAPDLAWRDNYLLIISEGLVVFFMLIRRRPERFTGTAGAWFMSFSASILPFLVMPAGGQPGAWAPLGAFLLLSGTLFQISAKVCLGRSFGIIPAHRGLTFAGPYRIVRHPIYAGYLLCHLGFLVINPIPWNLIIYLACYGVQIPRLLIEEKLLSVDPSYQRYRQAVRYRLIPGAF